MTMAAQLKGNWMPVLAVFVLIGLLFWLSGQNVPVQINDPGYGKKIDSLAIELNFAKERLDGINYRIFQSDSILAQSYKNLNAKINEIKKFTPDSRNRFRDSVRRANNL